MLSGGKKKPSPASLFLPEHQPMMKCFIRNYCGIPFGMCILTCILEVFFYVHSPCFKAWQNYDFVWDYNWVILPTFWYVQKRFVTGVLKKSSDNQGQGEAVSWSKSLICRNVIGYLCHFMSVTGQLEVFSSTLHHSWLFSVPDITVFACFVPFGCSFTSWQPDRPEVFCGEPSVMFYHYK